MISLFVCHDKHIIQIWNDKSEPTVPSQFIKGSPETTTKAPWLTSSLKLAVVSCILWGTTLVWCTDFKRLYCHCYVHHVRQTAKSPHETKWVKKEIIMLCSALLCLYKRPLDKNVGFFLDIQCEMRFCLLFCWYLQATKSWCCVAIGMCPYRQRSLLLDETFCSC